MSKDTIETDDKRLALRVFGLTESELAALREIACKEYGKPSVSLLAKNMLKAQQADYSPSSGKRPRLPRGRC